VSSPAATVTVAPVAAEVPPRATRRDWVGLAVIALPCVLYSMDLTVLNLAVPTLSADLKPTAAQLLWIVDIYGFLVAGSLITMGTLGDRIGRRKLLLIGAAAFGGASVVAAMSRSAAMLIASRALLGVAGATLAPSTLSLIRNMFLDARQRSLAVGVWIASYSAGGAIGPLLGGVMLERFGWSSVFLVSVPVMALLLVTGPLLLPEFRDPAAGRLDLPSAALSLVAVLPVIFGLKRLAEGGFGWLAVLSILFGVVAGALFIRRQRSLADPLIDLALFRTRAFTISLGIYGASCFVAFGAFFYIAQYLQLVRGLSPLVAGLWTMPWALGFIVGSILSPAIARRASPAVVMGVGMTSGAVGLAVLSQLGEASPLWMLVGGTLIFSLGTAPVFTLANDTIISTAPPERAGAASAISETCAELGGALGIAILGSLGAAIYRRGMSGAGATGLSPELSPEALHAARGTLGGAVGAASGLPARLAGELLASARGAFTDAFQLAAAVMAVLLVTGGVVAAVVLRRIRVRDAAATD
jgi:DHA2 family multidrug resistance protein-like MFS transporter